MVICFRNRKGIRLAKNNKDELYILIDYTRGFFGREGKHWKIFGWCSNEICHKSKISHQKAEKSKEQ